MKTPALILISLLLASCCMDSARITVTGRSYGNPLLWNRPNLTWGFDYATLPPYLACQPNLNTAVQNCFAPWQSSGVFSFTQAAPNIRPDIRIGFADLGCTTGHAGHAGFPWTGNRGQIILNSQNRWTTSWSLTGYRLNDWLPHEVGHTLGLVHNDSCGSSCMHEHGPYGNPGHHDLHTLQRVYSPSTVVHPVFGPKLH